MSMKHPFFEYLGDNYPYALEKRFERILIKIEQLWHTPQIHDYFSSLIIDSRGGRQGFPKEVIDDILRLRQARQSQYIRESEGVDAAINELKRLGIERSKEQFLLAVSDGDQATVDLFVRSNFNIHINDEEGTPVLLVALKKGYTVIAGILINKGADVNAYDRRGVTPLLLVCGKQMHGYKTIAEMLIKRGAYVNDRDSLGFTPLLLSLSGGTAEVAELLIERGADVFARGKNGKSTLALANSSGNTHIAELLKVKGVTE
ncbi:MAG: ankyrin repeat domain-containing protein [Methylotenera sp.]|nr:ankyrin repeat domain-containing protein [Methylotenera sp.]